MGSNNIVLKKKVTVETEGSEYSVAFANAFVFGSAAKMTDLAIKLK